MRLKINRKKTSILIISRQDLQLIVTIYSRNVIQKYCAPITTYYIHSNNHNKRKKWR